MSTTLWRLFTVVLLVGLAVVCNANPTTFAIVARRSCKDGLNGTKCPYPLQVFVDLTGTVDDDANVRAPMDLRYTIDCGTEMGNWVTGEPRRYWGPAPIGYCLYEAAGSFTISATVTDPDGNQLTDTEPVTVHDQNDETNGWADADTTCYSTAGTFTGCPSGSTQTTDGAGDWDAKVPPAAGKRILFRCGETWTNDNTNSYGSENGTSGVMIGGFGSCSDGNMVTVNVTNLPVVSGGSTTAWQNTRVEYHKFINTNDTEGQTFYACNTDDCDDVLWNHIDIERFPTVDAGAPPSTGPPNRMGWANSIFYIDNMINTLEWSWYLNGTDVAIVGSTYTQASVDGVNCTQSCGANFRAQHLVQARIAYNKFTFEQDNNGQPQSGGVIQFRGNDNASFPDSYLLFQGNWVHINNGESAFLRICQGAPCHGSTDVQGQYYWFLGNKFTVGSKSAFIFNTNPDIINMNGLDINFFDNIIDYRGMPGSATADKTGGNMGFGDATSIPDARYDVFNNTIIDNATAGNRDDDIFKAGANATNVRVRNNLIVQLSKSSGGSTCGGGCDSDLTLSDNPFIYSNSSTADSACPFYGQSDNCILTAASASWSALEAKIRSTGTSRASVVNVGFTFPGADLRKYVYTDYYGGCRGSATGGPDATWDIGAHEYGSTNCMTGVSLPGNLRGGGLRGGSIR